MADLETITLSELEEVSELLETDTLLVERGGRIKRFTGEVGGGNSTLIVTNTDGTLNKTFTQIKDALDAGNMVIITSSEGADVCLGYSQDAQKVVFTKLNTFSSLMSTGYPVLFNGSGGVQ